MHTYKLAYQKSDIVSHVYIMYIINFIILKSSAFGRSKLMFYLRMPLLDSLMMSILYMNWKKNIFIGLAHGNNCPRVDMLLHSDTLIWFRTDHSFSLMLRIQRSNTYQFYSLVWPNRDSNHYLPPSRRAHQPLRHRCGEVRWLLINNKYKFINMRRIIVLFSMSLSISLNEIFVLGVLMTIHICLWSNGYKQM